VIGNATAGGSNGLVVESGTNAADACAIFSNQTGGTQYAEIFGDGGMTIGPALTVDKGAGTLNVATGIYLNGVNQFQTGTFIGTLTGMTGVTTGTITYSINGKVVTLFGSFSGTSNTTAMTMTGLPAALQPATLTQAACLTTATIASGSLG
jgi:hypothetical protein